MDDKYIITEEQLKQIRNMVFREDEVEFDKMSWKIVSNPLSYFLKAERERITDIICKTDCDTKTIACKNCIVESLRREQP